MKVALTFSNTIGAFGPIKKAIAPNPPVGRATPFA